MILVVILAAVPQPVDYVKDVKPALTRCYACHGALQQKAMLRVDTVKAMLDAGAIVPGKSADSPLVKHVLGEADFAKMPPPMDAEPLSAQQVNQLRAWIDAGAIAPPHDPPDPDPRDHWAFRKPERAKVPRAGNPIDVFLAAERAKRPADNRLLLRRVYLDLIGLPPTPEQTEAFLKDTSPTAYEKVVDQLLASPQYGERWGRHFMDIWRYSDWWGLGPEVRNSQKHIWHWRDWIIESVNADLGYDEMLRQMLAADELYPTDPAKLRATGYLARQYFKFNRTTWLDETVEHTAKAFLGLTLNCAKCHDHKYDPITQTDYYKFRAIFEPYQVRTDFVPSVLDIEKDGIPRAFDCDLDRPTYKHERGDERRPLKNRAIPPGLPQLLLWDDYKPVPVKLPLFAYQPGARPEIIETYRKAADAKLTAAKQRLDRIAASLPANWVGRAIRTNLAGAVATAQIELEKIEKANPSDPAFALRGALKTLESNVETEASRMKPFPHTSTGRRSAFAAWLTDKRNPLTARVAVNHLWARHFGKPLVPTIFDFGRKGTKPTHPELLDWLAVELIDHKWSLKHLHRLMVTSQAYRMSRQNPIRMESQVVRDSLLHLAGQLDETRGGPPVPLAAQDASRRRSLYFFHSHNEHNKFLGQFDDANVLECYRRSESIVPQQALTLANSKFALMMADAIAKKLGERLGKVSDEVFAIAAFEMVLGSTPTTDERTACVAALDEWQATLKAQKHADPTTKSRANLVAALVNHNDFMTVR